MDKKNNKGALICLIGIAAIAGTAFALAAKKRKAIRQGIFADIDRAAFSQSEDIELLYDLVQNSERNRLNKLISFDKRNREGKGTHEKRSNVVGDEN